MPVSLNLAPPIERQLREKAAQQGKSLEAYLEELAGRDAESPHPAYYPPKAPPPLTDAEFDGLLAELDELPVPPGQLPANFSRADIYCDHD